MRSKVFDESNHAGGISNRDVLRFPEHSLVQNHRIRGAGQLLILAEPGDTHQHVTMFTGDERRVDAQMTSNGRLGPAGAESSPRSFQPLEREVPEIGLQKLADVVAELHVEVPVEHRRLLPLFDDHGCRIPENVQGRFSEDPRVRVVSGDHSHADAEVAVTAEDVDGAAETRPLRSVAEPCTSQQHDRPRQEQESRARPHLSRLPTAKPPATDTTTLLQH